MKAAVLRQFGTSPVYDDFADPIPGEGELLVKVSAASIKNIDKGIASGAHYASGKKLPVVTGREGVGVLENGQRIYAGSTSGFMAEKAIISGSKYILIPDSVDDVTAAALPNPALSAWFSLAYRAAIQRGDTVYINGATGLTGKIAIQLARYLGAGKIVASGRNPQILETLKDLGANEVISLAQEEKAMKQSLKKALSESPFDIVIDYTWGRPAEILLEALGGNNLDAEAHKTRYVTVGEMAGAVIQLPSSVLRSAAIEIYGIGGGSIPRDVMKKVPGEILPLLFELAATGQLRIDTEAVALKDIEAAWSGNASGKRLVVML
jgi:NADPH:quinone reductase-like Zn-dependent oxidoreductase